MKKALVLGVFALFLFAGVAHADFTQNFTVGVDSSGTTTAFDTANCPSGATYLGYYSGAPQTAGELTATLVPAGTPSGFLGGSFSYSGTPTTTGSNTFQYYCLTSSNSLSAIQTATLTVSEASPPPPPPPPPAETSSIEQTQTNIFLAFILFFVSATFVIWYANKS